MDILKLALFCVVTLVPMVLIKKQAGEQAILLTAAVAAILIYRALAYVTPLLSELERLFTRAGIESTYFSILLKTVAASLVTRLCADLCRDSGSQTLATLSEIVGTIAVLLISIPVFEAVIDLLLGCFGREGWG